MTLQTTDTKFAGSIPQLYDRYMVPMIFEPYALDICSRLRGLDVRDVLEVAAGTGAVTREMARSLPATASIVATDLNQAMIDHAKSVGTARPVEWKQADALQLPFADAAFDAVVCQFGAMFFPDRSKGYAEARRVLRPNGTFIFSVWDRIEDNEFISTVCSALDQLFPDNPPRFMHRGPHGYHDRAQIARDLEAGGFPMHEITTVTKMGPSTAQEAAIGYCQANPMRAEIESHGPDALVRATAAAQAALEEKFGTGPIEGKIQALVAVARK